MATDPNQKPGPTDEYEDTDNALEDILYARHAEIKTFEDLEKQRGTTIPALFNQLYKFVQNPSSVSVETYKRMIDSCDTLGAGVEFLITALAARFGRYIHPDEEITKFVNDTLDQLEGGWINTLKGILSAVWAGCSVGEIQWMNCDRGFVPKKIVQLPATTILFETQRTGELTPDGILQYQRNYNPYLGSTGFNVGYGIGFMGATPGRPDPFARFGDFPFPLRTANSFNYLSIRIPTQKCIHYALSSQGQMGNPYGHSKLRAAYKYYVMEDAIHQMLMIALDRKGTPLTVVFADPNAMVEDENTKGGTAQSNTQNLRNNALGGMTAAKAAHLAFKNVHNDSNIVLPGKKDDIYSLQEIANGANAADFITSIQMCKASKLRALLIPSLIFSSGDGSGSFALGQEHAKTFDTICDSTNAGMEHVLLQQFIKQVIAYNFPRERWEKQGLGAFSKRTLSKDEIAKEMEVFEKAIDKGIIDTQDLNDLNKMRDTIGFEPRATPIAQPDPFGVAGLNGSLEEGASPDGSESGEGKEVPGGLKPGKQDATKEVPPGSAGQKNVKEQPGGDTEKEAKKKGLARLMAAFKEFFGGSES